LSRDYTADEVGVPYRRLAKVYHPDFRPDQEAKQRNEEMLKRINAAEEILRKNLEGP
jgi:curved DNA-binding protein CbpA